MAPQSVRSLDVVSKSSNADAATKNAATITDLISTIPQTWRPVLAGYLNSVYRAAAKLCNVQNTIAGYDKHVAEGSVPASIRNSIRDPKVQYSKEFLGTPEGALAKGLLDSEIISSRKNLLAFVLSQKNKELSALQQNTSWDSQKWRSLIADAATRTATTLGVACTGDSSKDTAPTWTGTNVPSAVKEECTWLWNYGSTYHYRAIAIARSIADRSLVEKTKNLSIKASTDQEMRDVDVELTTREVVKDEMQAQLKQLKLDLTRSFGQNTRKPAPKKGKPRGPNNQSGVRKGKAQQKTGPKRKNGR